MGQVTKERLLEIAEMEYEDVDVLITAVREIAVGLASVIDGKAASPPPSSPPQTPGRRVAGKPIPAELRRTTCRECHADVVVFISKRTSKPYLCDIELGYYQNQRQQLSGVNWLHQCRSGR